MPVPKLADITPADSYFMIWRVPRGDSKDMIFYAMASISICSELAIFSNSVSRSACYAFIFRACFIWYGVRQLPAPLWPVG